VACRRRGLRRSQGPFSGLALAGFVASLGIGWRPADKRFRVNFLGDLWRECAYMRTDRDLWRANLGNMLFFSWICGVAALLSGAYILHSRPGTLRGLWGRLHARPRIP